MNNADSAAATVAADTPKVERGRCEDCQYWDTSTQPAHRQPDTYGACRAAPPYPDDRSGIAMWPFTEDTDWCGCFVKAEGR